MVPTEAQVVRKVAWRLLPLMAIAYVWAYFDRVMIAFGAEEMNAQLDISATTYGWIAGIFFIGYFLFEVPSNIILEKVGARLWIGRIVVTFGLIALLCAFVQNATQLAILRFLLGVAEAGFFPGMIIYLTLWFPSRYRARMIAAFIVAIPIASAVGGPLAGTVLKLGGALGLEGWRWLFVFEGIPTLLLGGAVFLWLTSRPEQAKWLTPQERELLTSTLAREREEAAGKTPAVSLRQALKHEKVLLLALIQTCTVVGSYGLAFWLPQLLGFFDASSVGLGFLAAIPYTCAAIAIVVAGRGSDRSGNRFRWIIGANLTIAGGFVFVVLAGETTWTMLGLVACAIGLYIGQPSLFSLPSTFLTGPAAAAAVAVITSVSNLGGFGGPYLVGWIYDGTGTFTVPLLVLAGFATLGAVLAWVLSRRDGVLDTPTNQALGWVPSS